jgi:hypothetical protein
MRSVWALAALAVIGEGCHCGQKLSGAGTKLVITQPTAQDGGEWVLDFGARRVGSTQTGNVVLVNEGAITGNLLSAAIRPGSDPAYSFVAPALPAAVVDGAELTLTVTYAPVSGGTAMGWLDLTTDDPQLRTATVLLVALGESSQLEVCVDVPGDAGSQCNGSQQTLNVDFGSVLVGSSSSRTVHVRDVGTAPLQYLGTGLSVASSPEYAISPLQIEPDGGLPVQGGSELEFSIVFTPTTYGAATGTATVSAQQSPIPRVDLQLFAHGLVSSSCALEVSPASLAFGSVPNTTPVEQTLVMVNAGAQACHVSSLPITGSTAFTLLTPPPLPIALPSNGVAVLDVQYSPSGTSVDQGLLTIVSDDPVNPNIAVPLSATSIAPPGCVLSAQPPSLAFGGMLPGQWRVMGVTLTAVGADTCLVFAAKIRHGDPAFNVWTAMPLSLLSGTKGSVYVEYAPTVAGTDGDELDLTYFAGIAGPTLTLPVPLAGAAGPAQLCLVPDDLHYGAVPVGQNKTLSFSMTACGTSNVQVSSIAVEPTGTAFSAVALPTFPLPITVGTSASQAIQFTPTSTGPASAKVHVVSDDPVFPDQYVQLDNSADSFCDAGDTRKCYDGPPKTENVGVCRDGLQSCQPNGTWPADCPGEVLPAPVEDCCGALDMNCNGLAGCQDLSSPSLCFLSTCCIPLQPCGPDAGIDPGCACPVGAGDTQTCPSGTHVVTRHGVGECCPCTSSDCGSTAGNCCGTPACAGAAACAGETCNPLPASCNGQVNTDCDDFPEDCDEPCCLCSSCGP